MTEGNNRDRDVIREYLLGHLNQDEAAETSMSDDILADDKLAEVVESIEDEIIEEYLEGTLDPETRNSVEHYFLQPPERQEKLHFARVLERHLAARPISLPAKPALAGDELLKEARPGRFNGGRVRWLSARIWVYGPVAALVVFGLVAAGYLNLLQRKLTVVEDDLRQEKLHSARLSNQLSQLQLPIVVLSLVSARPRSAVVREEIPHLEIRPSTERVMVEVAVDRPQTSTYEVRLESNEGGAPIWTAKLSPIVSANGDARLVFDLSAKLLRSDVYSLRVSELAKDGTVKYYDFDAQAAK
jgi:hypothetical protein